ncbi:MAG: nucleoside triphosphate pyrophosphohydrolase [Nitrospinae bacterium]|nr:nucleoside triphosphate pyrophosphohydrolase [Nitrospinota bacterium]
MSVSFDKLCEIMARLRGEGGCPWDREQTHESLKPYMVEEAYEVIEAIDTGDREHLKEELGDLILQVVFHAQLAGERGEFNIDDVLEGISEKLIRRHPHVFGESLADTAEKVMTQWQEIKKAEKGRASIMDGAAPAGMPALMRAVKIQKKAAEAGFDWEDWRGAFEKIKEEAAELSAAIEEDVNEKVEMELGDLLFSMANVARHIGVDPEEALRKTILKFVIRFQDMETRLEQAGGELSETPMEALDKLWDEAKKRYV